MSSWTDVSLAKILVFWQKLIIGIMTCVLLLCSSLGEKIYRTKRSFSPVLSCLQSAYDPLASMTTNHVHCGQTVRETTGELSAISYPSPRELGPVGIVVCWPAGQRYMLLIFGLGSFKSHNLVAD